MATFEHNFKVKNGLTVENTAGNDSSVEINDNSATAFTFQEGANTYLTFVSTNGSEGITFGKPITAGDITATGTVNFASATVSMPAGGLSGTLFTAGATAVEQGDTINVTGTTNEVEVSESSGTFTVGLPSSITTNLTGDVTGNADTATAWATARDLTFSGDATGTLTGVDGSATVDAALTLATVNSDTGSFGSATAIPVVTVNAKGLVTAVSTASISTDLSTAADSGTGTIALASQSLTISGTANEIETSASSQTVTIGLPDAVDITTSLTVPLIDTPASTDLTLDVTGNIILDADGGNVTIKDNGVTVLDIVMNGATDVTLDAPGTLKLDSANGYIDLVDDGVIFGQLMNHSSGNIKIMSGSDDLAVMWTDTAAEFGGAVTVPGATTLNDTLDVAGVSNFNDTTTSTSNTTGAVIIDGGLGLAENLNMGGNLDVDGNGTVHGNLVVNGDTDLGDATSDTLTVTARVDSDFVPSTDGARDLGTSTLRWAELHADKALLQGEITGVDYIDFDTSHSTPSNSEGRLFYHNGFDTLAFYTNDSNNTISVGQELFQRVYNDTGSTITAGKAVRFVGATAGGTPKLALADKSSSDVENTVGLVFSDIANAAYGYVSTYGLVEGIDTSGISAGSRVHVGANGALQETAPNYPDFAVDVGLCLVSDGTNGCILIDIVHHVSETYRTTGDARFEGDVTVGGNLTILGDTTETAVNSLNVEDPYVFLGSGDSIGESGTSQTTGSGLDDATLLGLFEGTTSTTYYVKIDGTGTPDTFSWSKDNFSTTEATGVNITGNSQTLDNGISVKFVATTGHTLNDVWSGTATPANLDLGMIGFRNTGASGVGFTQVGMFFDVTDQKFRLFDEYDPAITGNIDTSDSSFELGHLVLETVTADTFTGDLDGNAASATEASTIHTVQRSTNATHYLTFVDSDDASLSVNAVYTDAGITYNPSTNNMTIGGDLTVTGNNLNTHTIPGGTGTLALTSDINNATLTVAAGTGVSLSATPTFTANASSDKTITVTNSDRGSSQNIFKNFAVTDTDSGYSWSETATVVADSNDDTLTLVSGTAIDIDADASSDAIKVQHSSVTRSDTTSTDSPSYGGTFEAVTSVTTNTQGHVTAIDVSTVTIPASDNTNQLTTFVVEDGDGTEVTISHGKEWKFVEGGAIDINWTDTSTGSDADPYDLTISHTDTSSQASVDNSNGTVIQDVTLDTYGHVTGLGSVNLDNRYVLDNGVDNGSTTITVNDADFIVQDGTDTVTNFIWRDHSETKLYLGTTAAVITPRSDIDMDGSGTAYNISDAKSIGVGTAASNSAGDIRASADVTAYYSSDATLKENVKVIADPILKVQQLRGVEFDWTDEYIENKGGEDDYFVRRHDVGVIAQEVEQVLPEVVGTREDGIKAVRYDRMVSLLIEAVKEQQEQIQALTDQLNTVINTNSEK